MVKVCYLVLVYNNVSDTIETLKGIYLQDFKNIDVLIIDNNSKKEYIEPVRAFAETHNMKYIYRDVNDGYAGGNNFGWRLVYKQYDFVFVVNNDIVFYSNDLTTKIINVFLSNSKLGLVGPTVYFGDKEIVKNSTLNDFFYKHFYKYKFKTTDLYVEIQSVIGCFLAVNTKAVGEDFLFDKTFFMYSEEVDFALRLWNKGYHTAILNDTKSSVYHKGGNNPFNDGKQWKFFLSIRNAILCARNFDSFRRLIYLFLYLIFLIKASFSQKFTFLLKKNMWNGFFTGMRFLLFNHSSEAIYKNACEIVKREYKNEC